MTITHLPPELLHRILDLATASATPNECRQLLCSAALVASTWRNQSQALLFVRARVSSGGAGSFVASQEREQKVTRELELVVNEEGDDFEADQAAFELVLRHCVGLQHLSLINITNLSPSLLMLDNLSGESSATILRTNSRNPTFACRSLTPFFGTFALHLGLTFLKLHFRPRPLCEPYTTSQTHSDVPLSPFTPSFALTSLDINRFLLPHPIALTLVSQPSLLHLRTSATITTVNYPQLTLGLESLEIAEAGPGQTERGVDALLQYLQHGNTKSLERLESVKFPLRFLSGRRGLELCRRLKEMGVKFALSHSEELVKS